MTFYSFLYLSFYSQERMICAWIMSLSCQFEDFPVWRRRTTARPELKLLGKVCNVDSCDDVLVLPGREKNDIKKWISSAYLVSHYDSWLKTCLFSRGLDPAPAWLRAQRWGRVTGKRLLCVAFLGGFCARWAGLEVLRGWNGMRNRWQRLWVLGVKWG